jgi:hypothetical protein
MKLGEQVGYVDMGEDARLFFLCEVELKLKNEFIKKLKYVSALQGPDPR